MSSSSTPSKQPSPVGSLRQPRPRPTSMMMAPGALTGGHWRSASASTSTGISLVSAQVNTQVQVGPHHHRGTRQASMGAVPRRKDSSASLRSLAAIANASQYPFESGSGTNGIAAATSGPVGVETTSSSASGSNMPPPPATTPSQPQQPPAPFFSRGRNFDREYPGPGGSSRQSSREPPVMNLARDPAEKEKGWFGSLRRGAKPSKEPIFVEEPTNDLATAGPPPPPAPSTQEQGQPQASSSMAPPPPPPTQPQPQTTTDASSPLPAPVPHSVPETVPAKTPVTETSRSSTKAAQPQSSSGWFGSLNRRPSASATASASASEVTTSVLPSSATVPTTTVTPPTPIRPRITPTPTTSPTRTRARTPSPPKPAATAGASVATSPSSRSITAASPTRTTATAATPPSQPASVTVFANPLPATSPTMPSTTHANRSNAPSLSSSPAKSGWFSRRASLKFDTVPSPRSTSPEAGTSNSNTSALGSAFVATPPDEYPPTQTSVSATAATNATGQQQATTTTSVTTHANKTSTPPSVSSSPSKSSGGWFSRRASVKFDPPPPVPDVPILPTSQDDQQPITTASLATSPLATSPSYPLQPSQPPKPALSAAAVIANTPSAKRTNSPSPRPTARRQPSVGAQGRISSGIANTKPGPVPNAANASVPSGSVLGGNEPRAPSPVSASLNPNGTVNPMNGGVNGNNGTSPPSNSPPASRSIIGLLGRQKPKLEDIVRQSQEREKSRKKEKEGQDKLPAASTTNDPARPVSPDASASAMTSATSATTTTNTTTIPTITPVIPPTSRGIVSATSPAAIALALVEQADLEMQIQVQKEKEESEIQATITATVSTTSWWSYVPIIGGGSEATEVEAHCKTESGGSEDQSPIATLQGTPFTLVNLPQPEQSESQQPEQSLSPAPAPSATVIESKSSGRSGDSIASAPAWYSPWAWYGPSTTTSADASPMVKSSPLAANSLGVENMGTAGLTPSERVKEAALARDPSLSEMGTHKPPSPPRANSLPTASSPPQNQSVPHPQAQVHNSPIVTPETKSGWVSFWSTKSAAATNLRPKVDEPKGEIGDVMDLEGESDPEVVGAGGALGVRGVDIPGAGAMASLSASQLGPGGRPLSSSLPDSPSPIKAAVAAGAGAVGSGVAGGAGGGAGGAGADGGDGGAGKKKKRSSVLNIVVGRRLGGGGGGAGQSHSVPGSPTKRNGLPPKPEAAASKVAAPLTDSDSIKEKSPLSPTTPTTATKKVTSTPSTSTSTLPTSGAAIGNLVLPTFGDTFYTLPRAVPPPPPPPSRSRSSSFYNAQANEAKSKQVLKTLENVGRLLWNVASNAAVVGLGGGSVNIEPANTVPEERDPREVKLEEMLKEEREAYQAARNAAAQQTDEGNTSSVSGSAAGSTTGSPAGPNDALPSPIPSPLLLPGNQSSRWRGNPLPPTSSGLLPRRKPTAPPPPPKRQTPVWEEEGVAWDLPRIWSVLDQPKKDQAAQQPTSPQSPTIAAQQQAAAQRPRRPSLSRSRLRSLSVSSMMRPAPVDHTKSGNAGKWCKRIAIIGIHGWFPGAIMRTLLGEPTGTSPKFASMMESAVLEYLGKFDLEPEKITRIPLEGDGTISRRVEKLYREYLAHPEWVEDVHRADAIFVATHSQGSIVATQLLDRLIEEGHIRTSKNGNVNPPAASPASTAGLSWYDRPIQRVCCLAQCGIHLGPLSYLNTSTLVQPYIQYFESEAARELFEFQDTESEVSKTYVRALARVLDHGTKFVYVASLNDQVVPVYSGVFTAVSHPLILRALYIDGDAYSSSDFLSNLLVLLLRIRNAGLDDGGLLAHLSEATAGSLSGVGHSSSYLDSGSYALAVRYMFETSGALAEDVELQFEPFTARTARNDYEIPWALRDLIAQPAVHELFAKEFAELRAAFGDWQPKTAILRDVRRKLEPIRGRNRQSHDARTRGKTPTSKL